MEIIQEYIINTYVYLQLPPVIIGVVLWKRFTPEFKLFVVLLLYSVINEIFKLYYGRHIVIGQNKIFTNIYNTICFGFLFWLFYKKSNIKFLKKTIISICVLYVFSIYYEVFIKQFDYHSQSQVIPYIIGGFGILICVFFYFAGLLDSEKIITTYTDLLFWIAIAHFIYYLGFIPFKVGENYFASFDKYHSLFDIKIPVTVIKSIILSIGFIVCSRQKVQL